MFRRHLPGSFPIPVAVTPLSAAHRLQQQTADLYSRWRGSFPDGIDPDELKDAAGQFAYSDAALALPDALSAVESAANAATRRVSDLVKGTRVGADVASQLAAQRYWARAQRNLDAAKDPAKVVAAAQNLIANADEGQTRVLAEELADYLASRSVPAGWLPDALALKIFGLSNAAADAIQKAKQHAILLQNYNALTNAFAKDIAAPQLLDPTIATATPYGG